MFLQHESKSRITAVPLCQLLMCPETCVTNITTKVAEDLHTDTNNIHTRYEVPIVSSTLVARLGLGLRVATHAPQWRLNFVEVLLARFIRLRLPLKNLLVTDDVEVFALKEGESKASAVLRLCSVMTLVADYH